MFTKQCVVTLDLEGVLAPEIWIAVAEKTGIKDLRLTTRDIPDYDVLMKGRIKILERENIKLSDIQNVIANLGLLDGARAFMDQLRDEAQVIILSDTFQEFAYQAANPCRISSSTHTIPDRCPARRRTPAPSAQTHGYGK